MLFLVYLSVIAILTEACDQPMCSVQNSAGILCNVKTKEANGVEYKLCSDGVKIQHYSLTGSMSQHSYTNGTFVIHVTKGERRRKYGALIIEVKQKGQSKLRHYIHIQKRKGMLKGYIKVNLSCLSISTRITSVRIAGELNHLKRNNCKPKYRRFQQISQDLNQHEGTATLSHSKMQQNNTTDRIKRSKHEEIKNENCIVNVKDRTVKFYWKKRENAVIIKCGIISSKMVFSEGWVYEREGIIYCITAYTITGNYSTRIYYRQNGHMYNASPCQFSTEILEFKMEDLWTTKYTKISSSASFDYSHTAPPLSVEDLWTTKYTKISSSASFDYSHTAPPLSEEDLRTRKYTKISSSASLDHSHTAPPLSVEDHWTTKYTKIRSSASVDNSHTVTALPLSASPEIAALSERNNDSTDVILITVLAFLILGVALLLLAIVFLIRRRKKLQRIPEPYPYERTDIADSSEPTAMIITVDEYSRDISQLTSLLQSRKIKVVTAESSSLENLKSRHDWLEKTVSSSNHYIFIVNKQMDEIFKAKFNEPLKEKTEISSNWSTEYEGGACAYTIVLIRNEFIRSLTNSGSSLKSCHLVSFEEDDEMILSQLKHKFSLFQCIKTHCYNLYSNKQFRYNAACRIINNIKKTEKSRDSKAAHQISSGNHKQTVNDLDIESAFLSVNISSKHCFIPLSTTEDTDSGSDLDVTSDLLEK